MASDGICAIKEEFIVKEHRIPATKQDDNVAAEYAPPAKILKVDAESNKNNDKKQAEHIPKQKFRGQNKSRPKPIRDAAEIRPCPTIINVPIGSSPVPCSHNNCKYIHDALEYLRNKPKDIDSQDGECYVFETRGLCPRGLSCRYGSKHITAEGFNLVDPEKAAKWTNQTRNILDYETIIKLQKKKYDLSKAENLVNSTKKERSDANNSNKEDAGNKVENGEKVCATSGAVTDEDLIKLRASEKKTIDWKNKLYLSPLTTVGNLPFRRICKEYGVDITCGEMALCDSLLKGSKPEWALVKRHASEDLFGVQICGTNPYTIAKTAQILNTEVDVDFVDLNLGCPIDLVYRKGGGCGMLLRNSTLETSVKCASQTLTIPFTIKTRTGVYQETKIAHQLAPKFSQWGVSMMTFHGRSREQRYTKMADWEYIEKCAQAASPCPVYGNGDIMSYDDYVNSYKTAPHISGVMIGRGALIKPWIFTEIKEQRLWDIRSSERFDIMKKFAHYGLDHWGSDNQGVENTRKFLLEWISFLYRYVPVGLLERPPQRINERPPYYVGRDDLETMMASNNCSDWIKLSEMLLGPVPDGFQFLPKHKANSYK